MKDSEQFSSLFSTEESEQDYDEEKRLKSKGL